MGEWARFGDVRMGRGLRGEVVLLGIQSRDFTIKLARAFIAWLEAFGAEQGVRFTAPEGGNEKAKGWIDDWTAVLLVFCAVVVISAVVATAQKQAEDRARFMGVACRTRSSTSAMCCGTKLLNRSKTAT